MVMHAADDNTVVGFIDIHAINGISDLRRYAMGNAAMKTFPSGPNCFQQHTRNGSYPQANAQI